MCGRIMQRSPDLPGLQTEPGATPEEVARAWESHFNGAPAQYFWVIRRKPRSAAYVHDLLQWGLIPNWVKDPSDWPKPINARCEGIQTKPSFRDSYRARRCLVPIDLFFEWMKILEPDGKPVKGAKQPYAIAMKDRRPFAVAGVWESWIDKASGEITRSFAVVTCQANALIATIHDRMPVILAPENHRRWLDNIEPDPFDLMVPFPPELMEIWPISSRVNSPANNTEDVAAAV
ncbi:SOS response-associated peptidase [Labrys sp. (in: a-proteobacteria)]|uniref:SOS response-associated peptidase n=1 Tax=Labrys sp. (in: a-proteobacteria) TaxID=1917972 RepID=UPI0039E43FE7